MIALVGGILLAAGIVVFVLQPVITGQSVLMGRSEEDLTESEARRRITLMALRDLEYDRATGKLDDADYKELRSELSREALEALQAPEEDVDLPEGRRPVRELSALEREIDHVRERLRTGEPCPTCGHPNPAGSRFCARCGSGLAAMAGKGRGA